MNTKGILTFILAGTVLVGCYIGLSRTYTKGVTGCIEKGYDVSYCEYHASR